MPDPRVSILKRDGLQSAFYTNYADARTASADGDVIIVWGDLNEPINLKNKVDIWILSGVEVKNSSGKTITDEYNGISQEIHCKIYGNGRIINTAGYSCIFINHSNSELIMEFDSVDTSTINSTAINIVSAQRFHLKCKNIVSKGSAIILGSSGSVINNVNLIIGNIETGDISSTTLVATSIVSYANGLFRIEEILCKNRGHCILHRKGDLLAIVKKITTRNAMGTLIVSAVALIQDNIGTQKLVLYFDEINSIDSYVAIEIGQGTGIFIGNKVFSNKNFGVHITGINTKGYLKSNEIICEGTNINPGVALNLNNFINEIIIDSNYIQGYGDSGVIFINGANILLRNAFIRNTYTSTSPSSVGIFLYGNQNNTLIDLKNIKIVTGNLTSGHAIFYAGPEISLNVKNFGLFVNKEIDESKIVLIVGTGLTNPDYNYQYIENPLLT